MKTRIISLWLVACTLWLLTLTACAADETVAVSPAFADIPANAWYADAVGYCTAQGILSGDTGDTFSPHTSMTRSMLAVALYRMAASPAVTAPAQFTDAAGDTWYSDAVSWASHSGILSGYGNGTFGVNDPVTREQMAALLWRFAGSPAVGAAFSFADASSLSEWALPAVNWASVNGIMNGKSPQSFDPKSNVTRGEVAVILYRYLSRDGENETAQSDALIITAGDKSFTVTLEENAAARALAEMLPLTVTMRELNGNEKYYNLPEDLPTAPERPGTIQAGDLMLYGSDCLVLFYEGLDSSYSYTRLGRITDSNGLAQAVGNGNVAVTLQMWTAGNAARASDGGSPRALD